MKMIFDNDIKRKLGGNDFCPSESLQQNYMRKCYNNHQKSIKSEARNEDPIAQNIDKILKIDANFPYLGVMGSIQIQEEEKKRKKNNSSP